MIYARLFGGFGNQLFQYATARAVSIRLGVGLGLDRRYLRQDPAHLGFALNHFAITAEIDPEGLPPHRQHWFAHALWRAGFASPTFLRERGLGVNANVIAAGDETYLHGYFQSETYFLEAADHIRSELRIMTPPSPENKTWLDRIAADERAVSVHVRRGDYVSNHKGHATHGTCDADYYRAAMTAIAENSRSKLRAYVFSDDPSWAGSHLDLGVETIVLGHNTPIQHYEDLRLMSACRHHVIANSTFSWWGAWLNASPSKIIVAPRRWFATDKLVNPDILPNDWIKL